MINQGFYYKTAKIVSTVYVKQTAMARSRNAELYGKLWTSTVSLFHTSCHIADVNVDIVVDVTVDVTVDVKDDCSDMVLDIHN